MDQIVEAANDSNNRQNAWFIKPTRFMRILSMFLFLTASPLADAQFALEKSIQLLLYGHGDHYGVVPAGEEGVVFFNEAENFESVNKRKWELINLNLDFELKWRTSFESDLNFEIKQVKYFDQYIYLMFEDVSIPMKSVFFVRAGMQGETFDYFKIEEFLPDEIVDFEILGNSLFLIGSQKRSPTVLKFRFGDIRPQVLQGLYNEYNEILNIEVLPDHKIIQIITRVKKSRGGKSFLLVKQFDEDGKISEDVSIESTKGHNLLNAKAKTDQEGNICIVGTYAQGNSKLSNGIFTMVYRDNLAQSIYYYDYTNLHHFFDYLPEKEREKITKKYKMDGDAGAVHKANHQPGDLSKVGDQWIYSGEIVKFIEKSFPSNRNLLPLENKVFSHAMVLGIGGNGKLLWDKALRLDELSSSSSNRHVYVHELEGSLLTYYLKGLRLNYQFLDRGVSTQDLKTFEMEIPSLEQIDPLDQMDSQILPWYQNNFMTFGSFSAGIGSDQNKNIFYINKVSISPSNGLN